MHADTARRVLAVLDLTSLGDADDEKTIERLCEAASTSHGSVAAVCTWPRFVSQAVRLLEGTQIGVAAVANFPAGNDDLDPVIEEVRGIVADGADEVDLVYPWRAHLDQGPALGRDFVSLVREEIGDQVTLKVIFETGELPDVDTVLSVAGAAVDGGADFLKTSTGKTAHGASPGAVHSLLAVAKGARDEGTSIGVKVSGGVRDLAGASVYLELADEVMGEGWVSPATFRFGASSLLGDVLDALAPRSTGAAD